MGFERVFAVAWGLGALTALLKIVFEGTLWAFPLAGSGAALVFGGGMLVTGERGRRAEGAVAIFIGSMFLLVAWLSQT